MNILGFDTATPSTAVALARADGWLMEERDEVGAGERPRHTRRLLSLAEAVLGAGGLDWPQVDQVAVGVGPGGYTGLRIGLATARGLVRACSADLVGVSTLRALAEPVDRAGVAAVLDARRGEAFVAVYRDGEELLAPCVCSPSQVAALALTGGPETLAVGDGAVRFRDLIEQGGIAVAPTESHLHRVSAAAICRLARGGRVTAAVPAYLRLPDAELALLGGRP